MLVIASIVVVSILIVVNGLYVAAEFGAVAVRRTQIQERAEKRSRLAMRLWPIISDPPSLDRYIAACQVGITISSLLLGAYGQTAIAPLLAPFFQTLAGWGPITAHSVSAGVVLVVLTATQMVLGELLPKAVALRFPAGVALYTAIPVVNSLRVFAPLIALLNGSGLAVLRLIGVKHSAEHHAPTMQELDEALKATTASGTLAPEQLHRLRSALRLGARSAQHVMVPRDRIVAISADAPEEEALRVVLESPFTRFPVYRGSLDRVVGILHTKDVVLHFDNEGGALPPVAKLCRKPAVVPATTPADRLLVLLREARAPMALVIDGGARVVGLVTLEDLLADVFGELADEFKMRARPARSQEARS